jgi:hypothetical protein
MEASRLDHDSNSIIPPIAQCFSYDCFSSMAMLSCLRAVFRLLHRLSRTQGNAQGREGRERRGIQEKSLLVQSSLCGGRRDRDLQ